MKPRLYVDQKITAFVNRYKIHEPNENGEKGELIALAQQKRLNIKEKIIFYTNEKRTEEVFSFRAEKVFDVHGRYIVENANGELLGTFRKEFKKSLLVSSWVVMDKNGNDLFRVKESSVVLAVLRRFVGWIPLVGDLLEIIILFFRYHFMYLDIKTGEEVGRYKKVTLFRDHYALHMTDEAFENADYDWQLFAAMGVALDALQSR